MDSELALKDNVSGSSPASRDLGTEGYRHSADELGGRPTGLKAKCGAGSRRGGVHKPESRRESGSLLVRRGQAQGFDSPAYIARPAQHTGDGAWGTAHYRVQIHDDEGGTGAFRTHSGSSSIAARRSTSRRKRSPAGVGAILRPPRCRTP